MRSSRWRIPAAVLVIVLAGAAFGLFGSSTQITPTDMSRLVVHHAPTDTFKSKPYISSPEKASTSPTKIVKDEATTDPAKTGIYTIGWKTKDGQGLANIVLELLPTNATAQAARTDLQRQYENKKSYTKLGLELVGHLTIPQIPGVFGAQYNVSTTKATSTLSSAYFIAFRVGHVDAFLIVQGTATTKLENASKSIATSEMRVLTREEPGFSMSASVYRPLTALWYGLGAVGGILLVVLAPAMRRSWLRRRARRTVRAHRQEHRHINARGNKVLKRRGVPAWQTGRSSSRLRRRRARARR